MCKNMFRYTVAEAGSVDCGSCFTPMYAEGEETVMYHCREKQRKEKEPEDLEERKDIQGERKETHNEKQRPNKLLGEGFLLMFIPFGVTKLTVINMAEMMLLT